ncbi:hypothetical protein JTB14_033671 [Gonioctena quinquepunctata]|nr:hypothetical protein JTB14_033671 [Gonioctena quinquepunctata]
MATSLAVLGLLRALSIDNQLTPLVSDCFERLAIGERLNPDRVLKTFKHNTVADCKKVCSEEKNSCRAFAFGISAKGNATCELSTNVIKETADLKPIGTLSDTDFDLYIKKHDCTLVIDKSPHHKPPEFRPPQKPITLGNVRPEEEIFIKPLQDTNVNQKPSKFSTKPLQSPDLSHNYLPVPEEDGIHNVQTLVSIASGPQTVLNPVHGILVAESTSGGYDAPEKRPPFRPDLLNHPYNDHVTRPRPDDFDRPNHYDFKPVYESNLEYSHEGSFEKPYGPIERPDLDRFDVLRPDSSNYYSDRYGERPSKVPFRPEPSYSKRPVPHRYGSLITHPDDYNRPPVDDYTNHRPPIPSLDYSNVGRPPGGDYINGKPFFESHYDEKPPSDKYGSYHYDKPTRPVSLSETYDDERPSKPNRPLYNEPDRYERPQYPFSDERPIRPQQKPSNDYDAHPDRPDRYPTNGNEPYRDPRPSEETYDSTRPNPDRPYGDSRPDVNRPNNDRPYGDSRPDSNRPNHDRPYGDSRPPSNRPNHDRSYGDSRPDSNRPNNDIPNGDSRPDNSNRPNNDRPYEDKKPYDDERPHRPRPSGSNSYFEEDERKQSVDSKPIITHSTGYDGEQITSVITELKDACFRRVLAGKRVSQIFVKRSLTCETVEECQRECADEKRFSCEGFNYRLDPTGRGKGDCELINQPLSRLDIGRDLYPDPDYDYYERDRNAAPLNCNRIPSGVRRGGYGGNGHYGGGSYYHSGGHDYGYRGSGNGYADRRYDYEVPRRPALDYDSRRRPALDYDPPRRPGDRWIDDDRYNRRPPPEHDRRYDYGPQVHQLPYDRDYHHNENRRGDFSYHSHHIQDHFYQNDRIDNRRYHDVRQPPAPPKPDPYEPYLPPRYYQKDKHWDTPRYGDSRPPDNNRRNYYLPPKTDAIKGWGQYGGTYGSQYGSKQSYNYWGLNKYGNLNSGTTKNTIGYHLPLPEPVGSYLPPVPKPQAGGSYLDVPKPLVLGSGSYLPVVDNSILPAEPRRPPTYNFIKDECSLRSATGFRLQKGIVKKFYAVPNIYECELLCFKEKDFPCSSYAFRYTVTLSAPTDNCYLSNRNYKELDYYTDLEPDKDFDIYTMNNRNKCEEPIIQGRDHSECFWRVRSGQRLEYKVVRDSLTTKSIVECQIECLRSTRFTCRAFSYRYGSPIIGGSIDNCQLTDWPFYELDPRSHFIPEPGFEVYERGSYGHGCEPDHFGIKGQIREEKHGASKADQLCYIGFGSPARLLPQATRKILYVPTELDCKEECSKARQTTLFQCMSFSFRTGGDKKLPNCYLSDIYQRDLLLNMDYVFDADSWLFAWDNYNPKCVALAKEPYENHIGGGFNDRNDFAYGLDTWRVYSVSGWPCRRGALCQENRETGFWFCELEGGETGAWDYCCRPEHQCGASHGYPYQWCYVGPARTQWRKCSDRYFPLHPQCNRQTRPRETVFA